MCCIFPHECGDCFTWKADMCVNRSCAVLRIHSSAGMRAHAWDNGDCGFQSRPASPGVRIPNTPGEKSIHNDTVVNIPTSSSYPSCGAIRRQHLASIAAGSRWVLKRLLSLTAAAKLFTLGCQLLHPVPKWARNAVPQGSPVPLVTALKTIHTRWVCQFPCHLILRDQWVIDCCGMSSKVEWLIPTEGEGVFARFSPFVTNCTSGPADHVPNGSNISRGLIDALSNLFMPYWHRGNSTRGLDGRKNETKVCLGKKK